MEGALDANASLPHRWCDRTTADRMAQTGGGRSPKVSNERVLARVAKRRTMSPGSKCAESSAHSPYPGHAFGARRRITVAGYRRVVSWRAPEIELKRCPVVFLGTSLRRRSRALGQVMGCTHGRTVERRRCRRYSRHCLAATVPIRLITMSSHEKILDFACENKYGAAP